VPFREPCQLRAEDIACGGGVLDDALFAEGLDRSDADGCGAGLATYPYRF